MTRPATADHLVSKKQAVTKTVEVVLDPALAVQIRDAQRRVEDTERRLALQPDDDTAQRAVWEATQTLETLRARAVEEEAVVTVRFRSVGRVAWDDLLRAHPPTDTQVAEAKADGDDNLTFNPETFPQALVAISMDTPKMTLEQVEGLWDSPEWNQAELTMLFTAALEVNNSRHTLDLGKGSGGTAGGARKSRGAANTASRTASS